MREIKFRGYDGMEWVYSASIDYEKETDIWRMMDYNNDEWMIVDKVGQFTGLKDKNGKEIYEGDILKFEHLKNYASEWQVVSMDKWFWGTDEYAFCEMVERNYIFEVIGNIYENPELLEAGIDDEGVGFVSYKEIVEAVDNSIKE